MAYDIKDAVELGVTKLPNLDSFDDTDPVLEEDCNDIPVIDFSAILQGVSYIPSDHKIESEKCNWLFYSNCEKKYYDVLELRCKTHLLFLITRHLKKKGF